jgi:hypothetical protein
LFFCTKGTEIKIRDVYDLQANTVLLKPKETLLNYPNNNPTASSATKDSESKIFYEFRKSLCRIAKLVMTLAIINNIK